MKSIKRSIILAAGLIVLFSMFAVSCKTQHSACPAYGGEAKRFQIERTY